MKFISKQQVLKELGISRSFFESLVKQGRLRVYKLSEYKRYVNVDEYEDFKKSLVL